MIAVEGTYVLFTVIPWIANVACKCCDLHHAHVVTVNQLFF